MDAQVLGASVINVLLQFIPTADEIAKVKKFVEKKHSAPPPPPTAEGGTSSEPATPPPPPTLPPQDTASKDSRIDQRRLTELKIGKAEQFIFHMSKVSSNDY